MWHVLALRLGGTVAELQGRMTEAEFEGWREFYRLYPFDDFHVYHRPAALVAASFSGAEIPALIEFLAPSMKPDVSDVDASIIRALGG